MANSYLKCYSVANMRRSLLDIFCTYKDTDLISKEQYKVKNYFSLGSKRRFAVIMQTET